MSDNKVRGTTTLYRKDPCPIDFHILISEAMWYIFVGWCLWLTASIIEGWIDL